jgi:hypothetical protein
VLDVVLAAVAVAAAAQGLVPASDLAGDPGRGIVVVGLGVPVAYLVYRAFVDLPRAAARRR